jgi:tetratricopeptide (TPR) repeat protein
VADDQNFSTSYKEVRAQIIEYLDNSNFNEAYNTIKGILDYPGRIENNEIWHDIFTLFKTIAKEFAGDDFAQLVQDVIESPDTISVLYSLAYELYEQNLYGIAATVLKRANEILPQDEKIVTELISNLEALMLNHEACKILSESKELIESSDLCRFLLAFNSLMTGNIDEPLKLLPSLRDSEDSDILYMYRSLKGMLNRALELKKIRSLDNRDLRGWHLALNGSILLHLSPFGLEDAMFGRYAYVTDTDSLILDGITRLKEVLKVAGIVVPALLALPDRSSQILGLTTSKLLDIPLKNWVDIDINTPGLIVAYDLDENQTAEILTEVADHRPGQILWVHASCWTNPFPFAPDITTYLYQTNVNPWSGGGMGYDLKKKRVAITEADKSDEEEIAKRITEAEIDEEYLDDLADLLSLIEPLKNLDDEDKPGIFKTQGRRIRQRQGSPVQSNRFL